MVRLTVVRRKPSRRFNRGLGKCQRAKSTATPASRFATLSAASTPSGVTKRVTRKMLGKEKKSWPKAGRRESQRRPSCIHGRRLLPIRLQPKTTKFLCDSLQKNSERESSLVAVVALYTHIVAERGKSHE